MVTPSRGSVVLVRFPFSDLSQSKLRPAIVLGDAGRGDWILCQVTSKPYADSEAVELTNENFESGSLQITSYARLGKLFTSNVALMTQEVGKLKVSDLDQIVTALVKIVNPDEKNKEENVKSDEEV